MAAPIEIPQVPRASLQEASGPRSEAGKRRSSQNAVKHGILSEVTVLPGEPREKYRSLLVELQESLQPQGKLEELLVEKLASISWRYRRFLAAEGAEIRQGSEFVEWDQQDREWQEARTDEPDIDSLLASDPGLIGKIQIPDVLDDCMELLSELRREIESGGFDRKRDTAVLEKIYGAQTGLRKTLVQSYLTWLDTAEASEEERQYEGYATPEQCKKTVLSAIDEEIRRLREYGGKRASMESERTKLEILRRSIPEPARLDRLLRYEVSLERSFDRTLNQLERIQRLRRGQPVAPRIDVHVSE